MFSCLPVHRTISTFALTYHETMVWIAFSHFGQVVSAFPNIKGGKGCIIVTSDVPVKVYNLNGMLMGRTQNLPAGIYAVIMGNICTKVIVK